MSVRTITVTKDAYDTLAALKRDGESFSELVRRIAGSHTLLTPFAGAWASAPKAEILAIRRFLRDSDRISKAELRQLYSGAGSVGKPR